MSAMIFALPISVVSFLVATLFGAWVRRQDGKHWAAVLIAPIISTAVLWILLYGITLWSFVIHPEARNSYSIVVQALGASFFYVPAATVIGVVPALGGYLLGHSVCRRSAHP